MRRSPIDGIRVHPACVEAVDVALRPSNRPAGTSSTPLFRAAGRRVGHRVHDTVERWRCRDHPRGTGPCRAAHRALREAARAIDSWAYAEGVRRTQQLSRRIVEGFLAGFDLLVTPSMACLPPLVGAWRTGTEDDPLRALRNSCPMGVFTSVFNVTGQPAISLPFHHDEATGLPVGIQIVAAPWREDLLLQVSHTLELALPWAGRRPAVS
ncbi:amidase family protein [Streptomyces sp. NPDC055006]